MDKPSKGIKLVAKNDKGQENDGNELNLNIKQCTIKSSFPVLNNEAIPYTFYNKNDYVLTAYGTKVSKKATLCGSHHIQILGKSVLKDSVTLRGDLAPMRLGKFVVVNNGTAIHPPEKWKNKAQVFLPIIIGDYVTIGERCVIKAVQIGSCVQIGDNCILGKCSIIKDNSIILPDSHVIGDTHVPPYSIFGGSPARFLGVLYESAQICHKHRARMHYNRFLPCE